MDDSFADALYRDGRDLLQAARDGRLDPVWYRDAEVAQVVDLLCRGRSVLLVGADGVGKTAVIRGVAAALALRQKPGLVQISTTAMLAWPHSQRARTSVQLAGTGPLTHFANSTLAG